MTLSIWIVIPLLVGAFFFGAAFEARSTIRQIQRLNRRGPSGS